MDRERIERRDFRTARRGYDRDEVHAHLRQVADAVERQADERPPALAGTAAEQIRSIVDAAERSASEIRQRAEEEARRAGEEADAQVRDVRERVDAEAAAHLERVEEATDRLLERTAAAESELDRLLDSLRMGAGSLVDDLRGSVESIRGGLQQVRDELPELRPPDRPGSTTASATMAAGAATPAPEVDVAGEEDEELPAQEAPDEFSVEESEPAARSEAEAAEAPAAAEVAAVDPADEAEPAPSAEPELATVGDPAEPPAGGERQAIAGSEGARLIALNMALNGNPREETARYLSENFDIEDQDSVLDEVYSRVGG